VAEIIPRGDALAARPGLRARPRRDNRMDGTMMKGSVQDQVGCKVFRRATAG